jgi:hypothetical protein
MRDRRHLANLALSLVEGTVREEPAADDLLLDAFESLDEAATAHAYLAGFLIQFLAEARGDGILPTIDAVRALLQRA